MSCVTGINTAIEKILNNNPWFVYKQGDNKILILESPKNKINKKTSYGVAETLSDTINAAVNNGTRKVGQIVYPRRNGDGWGVVDIFPSEKQIALINANEEEIEKLQLEVDQEKKDLRSIQDEGQVFLNEEGDVLPREDVPVEFRSIRTKSTEEIAKGINPKLIKTKRELKYTQHMTSNLLSMFGEIDPSKPLSISPDQAFSRLQNIYTNTVKTITDIVYSGIIESEENFTEIKNDKETLPLLLKKYPILQYVYSYKDLIEALGTYDDITKNFERYKDFVTAELRRKGIKITKQSIESIIDEDVKNEEENNTNETAEIANEEFGERFDRSVFEINFKNSASVRVKAFVQSIKVPDAYELGMPIYADPSDVFADMMYAGAMMNLTGYTTIESKLNAFTTNLAKIAEGRPYIKGLLSQINTLVKENKWEKINDILTFATKAYAQETLLTYETVKQGEALKGIKKVKVFDSNRDGVKDQVARSWVNYHTQSNFFTKNSLGELLPNKQKVDKLGEIIAEGKKLTGDAVAKKFQEFFDVLGIKLSDKDIEYISPRISKALDKGATIKSLFGPKSMLENIYNEYLNNINVVFENNYGLTNEKSSMNELAKLYYEANPGMFIISSSKSADGKTKYLYIQPNYVENKKREWDNGKRKSVLNSALVKPALDFWNKVIQKDKVFKLQYFNGIKEQNSNRDGKVRKHLTDKEQIATMLLKHQADLSLGTYINMTLSDKTTTIETKMSKEFFVNSDKEPLGRSDHYIVDNGKLVFTKNLVDLVYNSFVEPEISRIINAVKYQNDVNLENFEIASKLFYIIPSINSNPALSEFLNDVYSGNFTLEQINEKYSQLVGEEIMKDFNKSTEENIKEFIDQGIIKVDKKGNYTFPVSITGNKKTDYLHRIRNSGLTGRDQARLLVMDMKLNYLNAQVKMIQFLRFDPYSAFKKFKGFKYNPDINFISGEDKVRLVESTWDEFSKRAAALIAPGSQGNYTWIRKNGKTYTSPNFNSVSAEDVEYKINGIKNTIADAQELVTLSEHIDYLMSEGKIPLEIWESIHNKIEANKGGFYKLTSEELNHVLNPTKPVYVNDSNEAGETSGLNRVDYIKSSRYPLIPEHEAGSERDKLRVWMETNNVQSVIFNSGKKLGRPGTSLKLFDNDGNFLEVDNNDLIKAKQVLSRDGLKNQQEIPHQKSEITNVSQLNRRIFDELLEEVFSIKEMRNIKGKVAKSIKEEVRSELFKRKAEELRAELGDLKNDHRGLHKLLVKAIKEDTTGSYGENDLRALELGKNNKFKFNIEFHFKGEKYQGLINSLINHNVKLKVEGSSFVQVSAIGSKFSFSNLSAGVKSGIIWTDSFAKTFKDGEKIGLSYIKKENNVVKPAQVIVSQYIKDENGKLLDLSKFITEDNQGRKILDTSKISKKLLQLIGTRIPNQGLMSTLPIEVVGFLPSYMENTIIVPDGITGQMGADFDVDKLYTYFSKKKINYSTSKEIEKIEDILSTVTDRKSIVEYTKKLNELKNSSNIDSISEVDYNLKSITDIENFEDNQLEQLYYDLHWMSLTHPAAYDKITKSVDMDEVGDKVQRRKEELEKYQIKEVKKVLLPLDFMTSIKRYSDNRSGKTGVSIFANFGSAYGDFQDKIIKLGFKANGVINENPIKIRLSKDSKETIDLFYIGKLGEAHSYFTKNNGKAKRSVSDFLNMMFTESVDNAKNQYLREFNWDDKAMNAIGAFQMLVDEKGQCAPIDFAMDLTSQEIITALFKSIDQKQDSFGNFDSNALLSSINELQNTLAKAIEDGKYLSTGQTAIDYLYDNRRDSILDPATLNEMWVVGKALRTSNQDALAKLAKDYGYKSKESLLLKYYTVQFDSLNLFSEISGIGQELMTILGAIYPYTKGIGPNVFATKQTLNQLNKLAYSDKFLDLENLTGKIGKDKRTGDIMINPQGEIGNAINESLIFAQDEIYNKLFPISSGFIIENIVNRLLGVTGKNKDTLGKESYINNFKDVFKAIKSYLYTSPELELFDTDIQKERERLITNENSLAERITTISKQEEFLKNGFLKNIEVKKLFKSKIFNISFKSPLGDDLDEKAILSGFYELATHPSEEVRQIAKDLAIYPFLTGDAGNLGRFIPVDYYMNDEDFSNKISIINEELNLSDAKVIDTLIDQIVQNNPENYTKKFKLSGKFAEYFKNFVGATTLNGLDTFSVRKVDLQHFDDKNSTNFFDSFDIKMTEYDEQVVKQKTDGSVDVYEVTKFPDYILISEFVPIENGEEFETEEVKTLFKRTSPLVTGNRSAIYEKMTILGSGNIKEYSYNAALSSSIIKNNNIEEREEKDVYETEEADKNPANYTNHSGGAALSDTEWDQIGREYRVVNHKHYREPLNYIDTKGQPAIGPRELDSKKLSALNIKPTYISQEDYDEGAIKATTAFRMMYENTKNKSVRSAYIIRNWLQVKNADAIYALGTIKQPGENASDKKDEERVAAIPIVKGGTGYAVQMAINERKPVYVFDGTKKGWYKYDYTVKNFVETETPKLTKNFAGIGSRSLSTPEVIQKSIQAIRDVYENTFKSQLTEGVNTQQSTETTNQPKGKEVKPGIFVNQNGVTKEEQLELFNYLKPFLEEQGKKTNKGQQAPIMIGLNLRWDYKVNNPDRTPVNVGQTLAGRKTPYAYYNLSINGKPLGDITKRFVELMNKTTGIDVKDYDGAIINLYSNGTFIGNHSDLEESDTAEKYPVVIVNIGGTGNIILGNDKDKVTVDLKPGAGYLFGFKGNNRKIPHSTYASEAKGFLPKINISLENKTFEEGSYRISITMRRVMPLDSNMPSEPNLVSSYQQSTETDIKIGEAIYNKLGDKTQSKSVVLPKDLDLTYNAKTFWSEFVPEFKAYNGDQIIIAYRGNRNKTFAENFKSNGVVKVPVTIGNPFDWQTETGSRKEQGIKSTKKFIDWIITGNNFGESNATKEYRNLIIDNIKNGELKGRPIGYYEEKGYATHATALDYLINEYNWDTETIDNQKTPIEGENISSKGSDFAKKLTNPYNAVRVIYKGKEYKNSEHAYQTWKSGEFNEKVYNEGNKYNNPGVPELRKYSKPRNNNTYKLMVDILKAKLSQNYYLVEGIAERGGLDYLNKSTHNVINDKYWESTGENKFMEALKEAYLSNIDRVIDNEEIVENNLSNISIGEGNYLYDNVDDKAFYTLNDGTSGAQIQDKGLFNKIKIKWFSENNPEKIVNLEIGGKTLSYLVFNFDNVFSLQDSNYGSKIISPDILNRIKNNTVNETPSGNAVDIQKTNENVNKIVVVPAGSSLSNMVIKEDNTHIYLMNDGQQEAYNFIKDKVSQLLKSRQTITKEDLESKISFDGDPLAEKFSGVIPAAMWNNMIGLAGRGGVGKTTVIGAIMDAIKEDSKTINKYINTSSVYLAPGHTASTVLQESLGLDSEKANDGTVYTIASYVRKRPDSYGNFNLISPNDYKASLKYMVAVGGPSIIIIDESSMVGAQDIKDITERLKTDLELGVISKMPIFIFMGDYRQLGPINEQQNDLVNKGIISSTLLLNKSKTRELTQVMRSKNALLHEIYDSVGNQIITNIEKTQEGEKPIRLNLNEYDRLTNQSTEDILVVDNEDGVIDDYTTYLAENNNPSGMFWVHYNNVDNPKTKEMSKKIRQSYFDKIGEKIEETRYRPYSKNDYVLANVPVELKIASGEYFPTSDKIRKILEDKKLKVNSNGSYFIGSGIIKPQSRYKVLDVITEKLPLESIYPKVLHKYFKEENILVDRETSILYNRQDKIRMLSFPLNIKIDFGVYNAGLKRQEKIKIINKETNEVYADFSVSYSEFKNEILPALSGNNIDQLSKFNPSFIGSSHTAQGNSIKNVIAGESNIREALRNPLVNQDDVFSSLYVALTRTSGSLIILKKKGALIHNNQEVFLGALKDDGTRVLPTNSIDSEFKLRLPDFEISTTGDDYDGVTNLNDIFGEDFSNEFYDPNYGGYSIDDTSNFNNLNSLFGEDENPIEIINQDQKNDIISVVKKELIPSGENSIKDKKTVLNSIFKKGNAFNRELMSALSVSKIVQDFTLVFDNTIEDHGIYNRSTKTITINPELAIDGAFGSVEEARAKIHEAIIHELMHHVTVDLLDADPKNLTEKQRVHVAALKNLFKKTEEKMLNDPIHGDALRSAKERMTKGGLLSANDKSLYYGLTDMYEFVSMLFSDKSFQEFMNNTEYSENKSVLDRFLDILTSIIKALGFNVKNDSVLKEGITNVMGILETNELQKTEFKSINTAQMQYLNDNFDNILNILNIKTKC
jgi:alkylated DNA repair dioxygenase AlkB